MECTREYDVKVKLQSSTGHLQRWKGLPNTHNKRVTIDQKHHTNLHHARLVLLQPSHKQYSNTQELASYIPDNKKCVYNKAKA